MPATCNPASLRIGERSAALSRDCLHGGVSKSVADRREPLPVPANRNRHSAMEQSLDNAGERSLSERCRICRSPHITMIVSGGSAKSKQKSVLLILAPAPRGELYARRIHREGPAPGDPTLLGRKT